VFTVLRVEVDDNAVWKQLNGAGGTGGVAGYRDALLLHAQSIAVAWSPVNDPLNAKHRGGVVGTFQASWRVSRSRPAPWISAGRLRNVAGHAIYVERGRSASSKKQRFSWTRWGGRIRWAGDFGKYRAPFFLGTEISGMKGTRSRPPSPQAMPALSAALKSAAPIAVARANRPYRPMTGFAR
jgi:hypothetical protein